MPTFDDPRKDATEAYEALRGLAHASRAFTEPADTYAVIGDLLGGVRSLRQVFEQLATAHIANRARAYDDVGSQAAGATAALAAADELHHAGALLDQVESRLDAASQQSGRIAWHPADPVQVPVRRWISVVFLDGAEADTVLDLIHAAGTDAAIEHLAGYDRGEDTVRDALANGYVYDNPPRGALDRMATKNVYTLTYSPFLGHVSLLREYDAVPDPALLGIDTAQPVARSAERAPARAARAEATDWFARTPRAALPGQGLSL
ncbi:hypothetical protein N1031_06645 [Herbiconiux moechotypicola]|uniref:Uncharacterized protein n=1 Tax=Herbiconiux moechotypicola TaxID=637393 RepID=A0ABN3DFT9_9MICO|nr:hypothetical protein [Herbiconiux moechotypicola]MCS5729436.1 hypothetical protein [Herbiconiux moechotypicola]